MEIQEKIAQQQRFFFFKQNQFKGGKKKSLYAGAEKQERM